MALFTRRHALGLGIGALSAAGFRAAPAAADNGSEMHGISAFGDLKYPADFKQFDYVNPNASKGGVFSTIPSVRANNQSYYTFNSLNAYIMKGEGAQGMDMTFATLMSRANDEPDAMYGYAAKSVQISPDKLTYRFTMRPEARFHDGSKLTAQDVAFSLSTLKEKGHPLIVVQLRDFVKAEAPDDATVVVSFAPNRARDVPLFVAGLPIFSKAYYATRPSMNRRSIRRSARGRTTSASSRSTVTSNLTASRTGGEPTCRSVAATTISTPCATNSIAIAMSPSKALPRRTICSARSSPPASGRPGMISPR